MIFSREQVSHISDSAYLELTRNGQVLKYKDDKVAVCLSNKRIVKHFYKRPFFSSQTIIPYALQFTKNAQRLKYMGIPSVHVTDIYYLPKEKCHLVIYPYLEGETIYDELSKGNFQSLAKFPEFIAKLHALGIKFRDLHTGNMLAQPNSEIALLDTSRLRFKKSALNLKQRAHNLAFLANTQQDQEFLLKFGFKAFLDAYFNAAKLSNRQIKKFLRYFNRRAPEAFLIA
ncbi:MAG TPA: hypothetical protein VLG38_07810 [Gammaproteobacteria bacterium]|nr:hypothetical protein [Gammaproteobacteria bacterium]